ncbi:MAG: hypothetical protein ABI747_03080, partial [Candidatus Moraniibacteriota bacterium]
MQYLADALRETNFPQKQIYNFLDPSVALQNVSDIVRPGDLILIKGSRGMRMEKIVEALLGEPEKALELLACQSSSWRNKPFVAPEEWFR